jgi:hypothetical protein
VAGRVKFDETIAERKVTALGKGLELIRQVQSLLLRGMSKETLDFLYEHGNWFATSVILLPDTYVENWRSIRQNLAPIAVKDAAKQQMNDESKENALTGGITDSWQSSIELARKAEASIYEELN